MYQDDFGHVYSPLPRPQLSNLFKWLFSSSLVCFAHVGQHAKDYLYMYAS
jgi:hypothetical protein